MVRNFTGDAVDAEVLDRILASGLRAPSAGNTQSLDLVVVDDPQRYWSVTMPDPSGFGWPGLLRAPVLVIPVVSAEAYADRYSEPDKAGAGLGSVDAWSVPYWWVDGGAAVQNLLLACVAEGLGACFFAQVHHEPAVRREFGIPDDRRCVGTVAIGHRAPDGPGRSSTRPKRTDQIHRGSW